jgi:hypothetical protein
MLCLIIILNESLYMKMFCAYWSKKKYFFSLKKDKKEAKSNIKYLSIKANTIINSRAYTKNITKSKKENPKANATLFFNPPKSLNNVLLNDYYFKLCFAYFYLNLIISFK